MSTTTGSGGTYGAPPAPLGRRVGAYLIDGALTSIALAPLWLAWLPALSAASRAAQPGVPVAAPAGPQPVLLAVGAALLLAWGGFQWWCQGTRGWTVGRRLLGLRTVDVRTGRPVGLGRALVRALIVSLGALACGVGQAVVLLSPLFDGSGRHRGWHDRVAEAVVVDVRGLVTARRIESWDTVARPAAARGQVPDAPVVGAGRPLRDGAGRPDVPHPAGPADAGLPAPAPAPVPEEPTRTRWSTLAAERQLDAPGLVLPPLRSPGLGPDLDTRQMPVVPAAAVQAPAPPPAPAPAPAPWAAPAPAAAAPDAGEGAAWRDSLGDLPAPGGTAESRSGRHAVPAEPPVHPDSGIPAPLAPAPPAMGYLAAPAPAALPPETFPSRPATPGPDAVVGWAVRLPDGTVASLDLPLLVGRNPDAQPGARSVPVDDPSRSVSKTHLMLGVDEHGPWVVDRASTNGTLVTLADGQRIVCLPDRRVRLADGSLVAFGDLALSVRLQS